MASRTTQRSGGVGPGGVSRFGGLSHAAEGTRLAVVVALGIAISAVMVFRSQVGCDQLNMLARGWLFVHGQWVQVGLTTSANGKSPGGLTSLLAGAPLLIWRDYRAPALGILLANVLAYGLLDTTLRRIVGPTERLLFAVFYWLNPWRAYHSAFVWNCNWTFLFGAVQMWAAFRQRRAPSFWVTLVNVLALGAFMQLHMSFVMLVLAWVLLVLRRLYRPNWAAVAVGSGLIALSLVPWLPAVVANPALLPGGQGFLFRGLVFVFPLLRGIGYWLRYPSLSYGGDMAVFDFSALLGGNDHLLGLALGILVAVVGAASVVVPLLAAGWMWRRARRSWRWRGPVASPSRWLTGYVETTLLAALISFALSPTTIMQWQGFAVLHAAVLPVVLWIGIMLRTRRRRALVRVGRAYAAGMALVLVCMAVGAPMYRRGGRAAIEARVHEDHPMYHELGLLSRCSVRVDPASDWTPDVFRPDPAQGR